MDLSKLEGFGRALDAYIDYAMKAVDAHFVGNPPGTRQARGRENVLAAQQIIAQNPPEQWIKPDGEIVLMSPWMADLEADGENGVKVIGAKEELAKINRAYGQMREEAGLG